MNKKIKICATIEARLASTRLPGKVLFPLAGKSALEHIIERVSRAALVDEVIVATTVAKEDRVIKQLCEQLGVKCHQGSVDNITSRLLDASEGFDVIVQATGDNPFIDPDLIDRALAILIESGCDYVCNNVVDTYPRGLDIRVFTRAALESVAENTQDPIDLVHGSYYIYRNPEKYQLRAWSAEAHHHRPDLRLTVDEPEDYIVAKHLYERLYISKKDFRLADILHAIDIDQGIAHVNAEIRQKEALEG